MGSQPFAALCHRSLQPSGLRCITGKFFSFFKFQVFFRFRFRKTSHKQRARSTSKLMCLHQFQGHGQAQSIVRSIGILPPAMVEAELMKGQNFQDCRVSGSQCYTLPKLHGFYCIQKFNDSIPRGFQLASFQDRLCDVPSFQCANVEQFQDHSVLGVQEWDSFAKFQGPSSAESCWMVERLYNFSGFTFQSSSFQR